MKGLSAKLGEHSIGGEREASQVNGAGYIVERDRVFAVVQRTVTYGSYFWFYISLAAMSDSAHEIIDLRTFDKERERKSQDNLATVHTKNNQRR